MTNYSRHRRSGMTLIEIIIVVILMVVCVSAGMMAIRFLNTLYRETNTLRVQREIQSLQYNMINEVRNSQDILHISSDTLVLSTLVLKKGQYDTKDNPLLFENKSLLTYRLIGQGSNTYLLRRLAPKIGDPVEHKFLLNVLTVPDEADKSTYIFEPVSGPVKPYQDLRISFHLKNGPFKTTPQNYSLETSRRSRL